MRTLPALIIGAAALSVGACAAADYGPGYGYGPGYAYGYDSSYDYTCYGNGAYGYGGYYGGYGAFGGCGWYDGFFYPGFGNFVFDRHHHRHDMTGRQRDYFTRQARGPDGGRRVGVGSSGGVVPPAVSQPQAMPGSSLAPRGAGPSGPRSGRGGPRGGFGGGVRGGSGGGHAGRHGG